LAAQKNPSAALFGRSSRTGEVPNNTALDLDQPGRGAVIKQESKGGLPMLKRRPGFAGLCAAVVSFVSTNATAQVWTVKGGKFEKASEWKQSYRDVIKKHLELDAKK